MNEKLTHRSITGDRAVSPVIGVILMVAITVILAAVIGAFVLEIGDQQETAPSTSFDTEENSNYFAFYSNTANLTTVSISHAGGDVLTTQNNEVKVNGNSSTWDIKDIPGGPTLGVPLAGGFTWDVNSNSVKECPPGEVCDFKSGDTWRVAMYGISREVMENCCGGNWRVTFQDSQPDYVHPAVCCTSPGDTPDFEPLRQGDKITIVWTASSGGKTQALYKYTVKHDSPDL